MSFDWPIDIVRCGSAAFAIAQSREALYLGASEGASTLGRATIAQARTNRHLFPDPTPEQRERVGEAARRLVELRDGWLNPPGLDPADLAKRTLTNLYNQRPTPRP